MFIELNKHYWLHLNSIVQVNNNNFPLLNHSFNLYFWNAFAQWHIGLPNYLHWILSPTHGIDHHASVFVNTKRPQSGTLPTTLTFYALSLISDWLCGHWLTVHDEPWGLFQSSWWPQSHPFLCLWHEPQSPLPPFLNAFPKPKHISHQPKKAGSETSSPTSQAHSTQPASRVSVQYSTALTTT